MRCRDAAALPACSPPAPLLLRAPGSQAGGDGPAEIPALPPAPHTSPALLALAPVAAQMCESGDPRAIAVVSWKRAGSASLARSLTFFKGRLTEAVLFAKLIPD